MSALVERYCDGHHIEVLRNAARLYREDPDFAFTSDFEDLMREIFSRVRANIERIIERLRRLGYEFESEAPIYGSPTPPLSDAGPVSEEAISWINENASSCPPVLSWFCREVGNVDLRQSHSQLADPQHSIDPVLMHLGDWDPLVFDGLEYFAYEVREEGKGDEPRKMQDGRIGIELQFAPDCYHKANISGGEDYIICLPCADLDPIVHSTGKSFINYLRGCIARGGFWGTRTLLLNRGYGWLGNQEVEPGVFLPDHSIFKTLSNDLQEF